MRRSSREPRQKTQLQKFTMFIVQYTVSSKVTLLHQQIVNWGCFPEMAYVISWTLDTIFSEPEFSGDVIQSVGVHF